MIIKKEKLLNEGQEILPMYVFLYLRQLSRTSNSDSTIKITIFA